ncbi:hypothetical protein [Streptomyces mirabilis]|uniref:hypothetical protein n=1 Tax=Streptomyces mirabilis TaxID=68239 RepID=UPI003F4C246F
MALTVLSGVPVAATGGSDGTVRLWDLTTASPLGAPLAPHKGAVTSLALESDEQGQFRMPSNTADRCRMSSCCGRGRDSWARPPTPAGS